MITFHPMLNQLTYFVNWHLVRFSLLVSYVTLDVKHFFNATALLIHFQSKIVLTGMRKTGGLWYVDPPDTKQQLDNDETIFTAFQPSLNYNVTFPAFTYCANVLGPHDSLKERIQFYHAAFGFPAISTFCFALDSGHLRK